MSFIEHIGILRERFDEVIERYRSPAIWQRSLGGCLGNPGLFARVSVRIQTHQDLGHALW
jgi:hypothetical protein